jgi:hypothetical protein
MKTRKPITAHFELFERAMERLYRSRCCDCDLVQLEPALDRARAAMAQALPQFAVADRGEDLLPIARRDIEQARDSIVAIAKVIVDDVGMQLMKPRQLERGCDAARVMLDAFAPYKEIAGVYAN